MMVGPVVVVFVLADVVQDHDVEMVHSRCRL